MARKKGSIVYLDTHVVVWLYDALAERLSDPCRSAIENNMIAISWMVKLELQYLHEIGRIRVKPDTIINSLANSIGLRMSELPLEEIINSAIKINWTRDTFDRLIAAESLATGYGLISKDITIRKNLKLAIW